LLYGTPGPVDLEIDRPRVTRALEDGSSLCLVVADRRCGKTVAVAAWARRLDAVGAWVVPDEDTLDRRAFWRRVLGSVEDATAGTAVPVPAPETLDDDVRRSIVRWASAVGRPLVLVIDGIDDLPAVVVEDLARVAEIGDTRVVLVGRDKPPGDVTRRATIVGNDALSMGASDVDAALEAAGSTSVHVDRQVLGPVALLGGATVEEAEAFSRVDRDSVRVALERARAARLGRWDAEERFVCSPLVARALSRPLRRPSLDRSLASSAVRTLAARGDVLGAVLLGIDVRDFPTAISVGSGSLVELITEHTEELLEHLSAVPLSQLGREPLVLLFLAVLHAQRPRGRVAMLAHYAWADRLARAGAAGSRAADRAVILIARSAALRLLGRERWAGDSARAAVEALDAAPRDEVEALGLLRSLVLGQATLSVFAAGDIEAARGLADRTASVDGSPPRAREHAWSKAAYIQAAWGDMPAARERLGVARALDRWPDYFFGVPPALAESMIAVEELDHAAAEAGLDGLGTRVRTTEFWPVEAALRAYLALAAGDSRAAVDGLTLALADDEAAPLPRPARALLHELLAISHLAHGEAAAARAVDRTASRDGRWPTVASVLLRLAADEPVEAAAFATDLMARPGATRRSTATATLLRAAAAHRLGADLAACRDVKVALTQLDSTGLRTPWAFVPASDREALRGIALDAAVSEHLLLELDRLPVLVPDVPSRAPLTVRERQVLSHIARGETNSEIADAFGVSLNTVRKQRASAYRKLGASTREQAVTEALERGVLDLDA
jgi:DNA-binding CsgD family transcriptional regulator